AKINNPSLGNDSISTVPIISYTHFYELRVRLNPLPKYGIDAHLSYFPSLKLMNSNYKSITGEYDVETLVKSKMTNENNSSFIQGQLNFFFNPKKAVSNTDRGGLYFKLNF